MVAVYAVPAVLVEETEKKTMEALTLIASTADVIAAKALFGIALSVVAVPVLLVITRGDAADVAALAAVVVLSAVVLVGIGLLTSGLLKTQQQVNTWSGVILLALLAPAFTIGIPTPDAVNKVLWLLPTGHSFRLIANAFAGRTIYPHALLSLGMLLAWGADVPASVVAALAAGGRVTVDRPQGALVGRPRRSRHGILQGVSGVGSRHEGEVGGHVGPVPPQGADEGLQWRRAGRRRVDEEELRRLAEDGAGRVVSRVRRTDALTRTARRRVAP